MLAKKNIFNYCGHEAIEHELLLALKQNKLHHGLLFVGQEGIGKATLALRFAAFLMSGATTNSIQLDSRDPMVHRLVIGSHGDFKYVTPSDDKVSKEISVEQIRGISHFLSQTPLEGGWRIVLIDGALNRQASNALLKSLEEPPRQTLIILITTQAGQILPTIRSRCRIVQFRKLSDTQLQQALHNQHISDFPSELLPFCQGSPGKAIQLYQIGAANVLKDLYASASQAQHKPEQLYSFCETYAAKPKKDETVDKLPLVFEMLAHIVFQKGMGQAETFPIQKSAPEWAETWQCLQRIQNDFQLRYLDRMQSLLSAVNAVVKV